MCICQYLFATLLPLVLPATALLPLVLPATALLPHVLPATALLPPQIYLFSHPGSNKSDTIRVVQFVLLLRMFRVVGVVQALYIQTLTGSLQNILPSIMNPSTFLALLLIYIAMVVINLLTCLVRGGEGRGGGDAGLPAW